MSENIEPIEKINKFPKTFVIIFLKMIPLLRNLVAKSKIDSDKNYPVIGIAQHDLIHTFLLYI